MEIKLTNFLATHYIIFADFHILGTSLRGILTNVYRPFSLAPKQAFLNSLKMLNIWVGQRHWIVGGDFNLIHNLGGKKVDYAP